MGLVKSMPAPLLVSEPHGSPAGEGVCAGPARGKEESVHVIFACSALVEEHPWRKLGWS